MTVRRARTVVDASPFDFTAYDVVHAHVSVVAPFTSRMAAIAAHRQGVPTVVTVHSMWTGLGPVPALAASLAGLRGAPVQWTAVSRVAAARVAPLLPGDPQSVLVVPNAVEVPPRDPRPERHSRRPGAPGEHHAHRPPQAAAAAADRSSTSSDGPPRCRCTSPSSGTGRCAAGSSNGCADGTSATSVTLTGRLEPPEVQRALAASDVYVAPATLESFGLAALEARCVGLPVVGRAASGLHDFVRDGVEGWLAPSDPALVDRLRVLVEDPLLQAPRLRAQPHLPLAADLAERARTQRPGLRGRDRAQRRAGTAGPRAARQRSGETGR